MELFLHTEGGEEPDIVGVEASAKVRELLAGQDPDAKVWIEDSEEEIDPDLTLEEAGIRHRHHVYRGRCRRVEVVVRFNGEHTREFGPNSTIKKVFHWASGKKAFDLSPEQAAKHVLAVPGADHFLADGVHVGSLITPGTCKVVLDLCPRERFEG